MITGWIAIDCEPQCMTELQKQIKRLADSGKGPFEIGMKLHIGRERVIEEIYEIRKKECINSMAKRLSEEEKAKVIALREGGANFRDIAKQCYISPQTASNVWQAHQLKQQLDEAFPDPEEKKPVATINQEFEAAVDAMIAESKEADATKTEFDEILATDVADCPECLPPAVVVALTVRIHDLEEEIAHLTAERNELTEFMEGRA